MLKRVWSYTVDFCIRFQTIRDNPTRQSYIESATALSDIIIVRAIRANFVLITRKEGGA